MNEQEVIAFLTSWKPFATRLAQAGYDYTFEPADLAYLPVHEKVKEYLLAHEGEGDQLQTIYMRSGLSSQEVRWLIAFYVMRETLIQHAAHPAQSPYQPFRELLTQVEQAWQADQAFGYVELWNDLDLHVLVEQAQTDPLILFGVQKKLTRMQAEIAGNPLPAYTPLEAAVLSAFYQHAQANGLLSLIPPDTRSPSEVIDIPWLLVMRQPGQYSDYDKTGKWMIFVSRSEVDALWQRIVAATSEGQLGPLSKVSTAKPTKHPHRYEHVIQVYTDDQTDQADRSRVREALRTLGIVQFLSYRPVREQKSSTAHS